jgi:hypothetical protein
MSRYKELVEKCEKLRLTPPPEKDYMKSPAAVKGFIDVLLDAAGKGAPPADRFVVKGDWVSSVVDSSGKVVYIAGENLEISVLEEEVYIPGPRVWRRSK